MQSSPQLLSGSWDPDTNKLSVATVAIAGIDNGPALRFDGGMAWADNNDVSSSSPSDTGTTATADIEGFWTIKGVVCEIGEAGAEIPRGLFVVALEPERVDSLVQQVEATTTTTTTTTSAAAAAAADRGASLSGLWLGEAAPDQSLAAFGIPTNPIRWVLSCIDTHREASLAAEQLERERLREAVVHVAAQNNKKNENKTQDDATGQQQPEEQEAGQAGRRDGLDELALFVNTMDGRRLRVMASPNDTVPMLKVRIAEAHQFPASHQMLVFGGKLLTGTSKALSLATGADHRSIGGDSAGARTLEQLGLSMGANMHLTLRAPNGRMHCQPWAASGGGCFNDSGDVPGQPVLRFSVSGDFYPANDGGGGGGGVGDEFAEGQAFFADQRVVDALARVEVPANQTDLGGITLTKIYEESPETQGFVVKYAGRMVRDAGGAIWLRGVWSNLKDGGFGQFYCRREPPKSGETMQLVICSVCGGAIDPGACEPTDHNGTLCAC